MIFAPGWVIALFTFPGVICHEMAHRLFCDLARVPVYKACYIRAGNPAGYIVHGPVRDLKSAFLISIGPLLANTVLCALISFSAVIPTLILRADASPLSWLLLWVGISMGMHAFPSDTDMANFNALVKTMGAGGLAHMAGRFFGGLFGLANVLRVVWFDMLYAFGVAVVLPGLTLGIWGGL